MDPLTGLGNSPPDTRAIRYISYVQQFMVPAPCKYIFSVDFRSVPDDDALRLRNQPVNHRPTDRRSKRMNELLEWAPANVQTRNGRNTKVEQFLVSLSRNHCQQQEVEGHNIQWLHKTIFSKLSNNHFPSLCTRCNPISVASHKSFRVWRHHLSTSGKSVLCVCLLIPQPNHPLSLSSSSLPSARNNQMSVSVVGN